MFTDRSAKVCNASRAEISSAKQGWIKGLHCINGIKARTQLVILTTNNKHHNNEHTSKEFECHATTLCGSIYVSQVT
jgi:hypothetical protein